MWDNCVDAVSVGCWDCDGHGLTLEVDCCDCDAYKLTLSGIGIGIISGSSCSAYCSVSSRRSKVDFLL